jgi:DNA ligase-1
VDTLKQVYEAIEDIASESSRLTKEKKIQKYLSIPYFTDVVKYAYDFNKKYNVTNLTFIEQVYIDINTKSLFEYLDYLSTLSGATDTMKLNLSMLSSLDRETNILVNRIVNKDLKCGVGENSFKKYIKDLPVFEIMTCQKDIPKFLKLNKNKPYYYSKKKDGVRVICKVFEKHVDSHTSRSGLEYFNFNIFDDDLIYLAKLITEETDLKYPILIDGEAISTGKNFNKVMTQIRKIKDADLSTFKFHVFDLPCDKVLSDRYKILDRFLSKNVFQRLDLVEHHLCNLKEQELIDLAKDTFLNGVNGVDEGIVIKVADSIYEWKEHSKYWCKIKPTDTLDLPVIGHELGKIGTRLEGLVGALIVDFKGVEVRVGSGLSDEQRYEFLDNPPSIIEVEFKEITPDGSLREPTMKRARDDKNIHD